MYFISVLNCERVCKAFLSLDVTKETNAVQALLSKSKHDPVLGKDAC